MHVADCQSAPGVLFGNVHAVHRPCPCKRWCELKFVPACSTYRLLRSHVTIVLALDPPFGSVQSPVWCLGSEEAGSM